MDCSEIALAVPSYIWKGAKELYNEIASCVKEYPALAITVGGAFLVWLLFDFLIWIILLAVGAMVAAVLIGHFACCGGGDKPGVDPTAALAAAAVAAAAAAGAAVSAASSGSGKREEKS